MTFTVPQAADLARRHRCPVAISVALDSLGMFQSQRGREFRDAFDLLVQTLRAAVKEDLTCDLLTSRENLAQLQQRDGPIEHGIRIRAGAVDQAAMVVVTFHPGPARPAGLHENTGAP
jgi:hypothetical protein